MQHVVIRDRATVVVESGQQPVLPGPDGALVRITAASICGSDLHFYEGDLPLYPLAVGHEAIGVVEEVGSAVSRLLPGDRVMVASALSCDSCPSCRRGDPTGCALGTRIFGVGDLPGTQAERVAVPVADVNLVRIPDDMDDATALVLTDNLPTGWAGVARADVRPGGTVAVIGLGAVGQCAVRAAFAQGAARVLAVDPVLGRREVAAAFGATPVEGPTVQAILDETSGAGADAVVDAVGVAATLDDALACVRHAGTVSVIGVHDLEPYPLPLMVATYRSLTLRMTTMPLHSMWEQVLPVVAAGRIRVDDLVTHWFNLDDADQAYALAAQRRDDCLKVGLRI